jgi:hypothetical protein
MTEEAAERVGIATSAAEAAIENRALNAGRNRCSTQNQSFSASYEVVPFPAIEDGQLAADVHHRSRGRNEVGFANVVALFFLLDHASDELLQLFI